MATRLFCVSDVQGGVAFQAVRILSQMELIAKLTCAAGGSRIEQIKIGTVYPATMGMLPVPRQECP